MKHLFIDFNSILDTSLATSGNEDILWAGSFCGALLKETLKVMMTAQCSMKPRCHIKARHVIPLETKISPRKQEKQNIISKMLQNR